MTYRSNGLYQGEINLGGISSQEGKFRNMIGREALNKDLRHNAMLENLGSLIGESTCPITKELDSFKNNVSVQIQ